MNPDCASVMAEYSHVMKTRMSNVYISSSCVTVWLSVSSS